MTHGHPGVEPRILVSDGFRLDARVHRPRGEARGSVAVAHPHPGHGGHMDHPVVVALAARAAALGLASLRFDVRGVRHSDGDVADAAGHLTDLRVASQAIADEVPSGRPRLGSGFSYGARLWLAAMAGGTPPPVVGLVLAAPATRVPRSARDFGDLLLGRPVRDAARDATAIAHLGAVAVPTRVLVGEGDVVAPPDELRAVASRTTTVTVLPGLNHFFSRSTGTGSTDLDALHAAIDDAFAALLALPDVGGQTNA